MSEKPDDILAQIRAGIENRLNEQLVRHLKVDPNVDHRRIVELQMQQEREKLESLIEENEDNPDLAAAFRALMDWLPELERKLKGR